MEGDTGCGGVHVVSRRMVRPFTPPPPTVNGSNGCHPPTVNGNGCHRPKEEEVVEVIHLTPWDLRLISVDYIQEGILLPKPPAGGDNDDLVSALQSSFARALRLFYPFAGRLASEEHDDGTVSVFLRCTGEGAEFVHAVAPEVAVADILSSLYTPPVVWKLFPLSLVLGADAAIKGLPVLAVQVTVLADGVFVGMTLNHSVGDGTAFWHFFNTWSEINRAGGGVDIVDSGNLLGDLSTPPPVFDRWFLDTCPVPIPMPFTKLEHIVRRFERTPVKECFFTFSTASVKKLKARANAEMTGTATATATISSLQAVLAHFWRAACRARRLAPEQRTFYSVVVGCRGRVNGKPPAGYLGNALVFGKAEATAGEVEKGLGWTAWLLNRAVSSFDEATMRESLERWVLQPDFTYMDNLSSAGTALITGSSPRFDVFGNDFGWGKPLAVRSGAGNKADGKATVFEGPERGGSISLEVCIAPDALQRLVADQEFMDAVSTPIGNFEHVINAVPISAVPPQLPPHPPFAGREEPLCLRKHFLEKLGLRADLPVHFIGTKRLTATDLDPNKSRFRIPIDGAIDHLRPLLNNSELHDANLFLQGPKRSSRKKETAELQSAGVTTAETSKKIKKPKAKGKVHGGLRVKLVDLTAGAKELLLSGWENGTTVVVKGKGYSHFMNRCGFKEKDAVEIWAFVQRRFRIFGEDIYRDSLLHLLIVKDERRPPQCCYCPLPSPTRDLPVRSA